MSNIHLYSVMVGDRPMVRYLMKQKGGNVEGKTSPKSAMWMLTNDKAKVPHMTEEFTGFPLTADGVYFFDGEVEDGETTSSTSGQSTEPLSAQAHPETQAAPVGEGLGDGDVEAADIAPVCGPDWCEIPEPSEKPKRKKRTKDVVCE